ncbi:MAG: hypothetical protein ACK5GV_08270 [Bacteroidota bacterium]|jgi:hypothetical protein
MLRIIIASVLAGCCLFSCTEQPKTSTETTVTASVDSTDLDGCFLHALNKDSTFLQLTLKQGKATGKFFWLPDQKDRANGILEGTYQGDTIRVKYTYMIEGMIQEEDKIMVLQRDSISVLYGPLEAQGNKFTLKDEKNLQVAIRMGRADCASMQFPEFKKD